MVYNKIMNVKRVLMSVIGVIICGASVGFFKLAAFGVDPFQCFMCGLIQLIPISFGTLYLLVNIFLLLFSLIFDRRNIGLATFINMFLLGYITQFTYGFLLNIFPNPVFFVRFVSLLIGLFLISLSISLYSTAALGVSTYDAIAITMAEKWKVTKFQYCRIITDVVSVVLGVVIFLLAGGKFADIPTFLGIGTIITAFFMGPMIEFFNVKISRPLLAEKNVDKSLEKTSEE